MAADWYKLMIVQNIMWPSNAHISEQLNPHADIPPPQSTTQGLNLVARSPLWSRVYMHIPQLIVTVKINVYQFPKSY